MKTPDTIKNGLAYCSGNNDKCNGCPYNTDNEDYENKCLDELIVDALTYIQQLESDNESKQKRIDELESRLAQVERERDALNHDLTACFVRPTKMCRVCANVKTTICNMCERGDCFKWRGVCEENTKEDSTC